jgi:chromate reductase, NAD(P)H dehydrogenase (quinone)
METVNIVALAGSVRSRSFNRALLQAAAKLAPPSVRITLAEIAELPHYNEDLEVGEGPEAVARLKAQVSAADGLLIATPEYNYGIPGVLKNALDWLSRPAYRSPLAQKPVAILGAAKSAVGTARAQGQLKQVLLGTVSDIFPHRELVVGAAHTRFDEELRLIDEATRDALQALLTSYAAWLEKRR